MLFGPNAVFGRAGILPLELVTTQTTQFTAVNSSEDFAKPSGVQEGNTLIAFICTTQGRTWTFPSGWTKIVESNAMVVATKTATSSEPSTYTISLNSAAIQGGTIAVYRNVGAVTAGTPTTTTDTNPVEAPSISMPKAGGILIAAYFGRGPSRTFSTPSGMTALAGNNDAEASSWNLFSEARAASGATGTRTAALDSGSDNPTGVLIGLTPV